MQKTKTKIIAGFTMLLMSFAFFSFAWAEVLKIGFVTDWEYGSKNKYDHKLPKKATSYLKSAVKHFNKAFHPDLVVGGGDYVLARGDSKKKVEKQMKKINKVFQQASADRLYCMGNHDLSKLSKVEVQNYLGINYNHSVTDENGIRVITLDTNSIGSGDNGYGMTGRLPDGELEWLEENLDTELPVVVFSHQSPISTLESNGWRTNIYEAANLRAVLEKNGNVVAVFSGHTAVNYSTEINGISYAIINNLVDERAKGSFADITVEKIGNNVSVTAVQLGKKSASYIFSKVLSN
jgi:hypothetical protein